MNSIQLATILQKDTFTSRKFIGVFASDNIPKTFKKFPVTFILNTDPHTKPGTHWIAVFVKSNSEVEFFDSYGHAPNYFKGFIHDYFTRFSTVIYNDVLLQSHKTAVCGQYCCYYVYLRCRNKPLKRIVNVFGSDLLCNDIRVFNFVKKKFNVSVPFFQ